MPSRDEYYNSELPSASNSHWIPWLQKQLLINEIDASSPDIPHAFKPEYSVWTKEFERFDINRETSLVGHSCGAGFLIRWLSEHQDVQVKTVVLVAPWIDPLRKDTTDFFEFTMDPELAERTSTLWLFNSDTDSDSVHISADTIRSTINNIKYKEFHNYGHFTQRSMQTVAFPELLNSLITK